MGIAGKPAHPWLEANNQMEQKSIQDLERLTQDLEGMLNQMIAVLA